MSFVLMLVGLLTTAVGAILIGTGIPINEFSLGNTLILSGTVTVVGGLVIFALSRVLAQLSRIGDLLVRPGAALPAAARDPLEAQPDPGRGAAPRPAAGGRTRAEPPATPRAPEPRLAPDELDVPVTVEPTRPPPPPRVAPPIADETLPEPSVNGRQRAEAPAKTGWRPPRPSELLRPKTAERRAAPAPTSAPAAEPFADERQEPVTVLKSGVVDGMAYTLYTDGSIEAELAQGVVRFGSIEELRNHLEKSA